MPADPMARVGSLAIEMSSRRGGVALRGGDGAIRVSEFEHGDRRREPLVPAIDELVRGADLRPRDLSVVIVSIGPGGFTGLRIAVATAKGLAEALSIPVVEVPSTLVAAESRRRRSDLRRVMVVAASKRDSAWLHAVEVAPTAVGWRDLRPAATWQRADLAAQGAAWRATAPEALVADEHQSIEVLAELARLGMPAPEPPCLDAGVLLELGERRLAAGEATDPLHLAACYPREPEAVSIWNARHPEDR